MASGGWPGEGPSGTFVVLMNAGAARILGDVRPDGRAEGIDERLAHPVLPLREIMADRPGRSFSSGSHGQRSAMVYASDPEREADRAFAEAIAARLGALHREGALRRLAILAAPEMLGHLRAAIGAGSGAGSGAGLGAAVVLEEAVNLLNLPEPDLAPALARHLAEGGITGR